MRFVLTGSGASRGMALGRARLQHPSRYLVDDRPLPEDEVDAEIDRLKRAIEIAREELALLRNKLHGALAREVADFIDAHSLMLADRELTSGIFELIRRGRMRASAALNLQRDRLVAVFEAMDDPYLRSRKEDVEHVIARVHAGLQREASSAERKLAERVGEILVTDTVAPSELVPLAELGVLGVVLSSGSRVSHGAILARSLHLPMVVAAHEALGTIHDGDLILIDGEAGEVIAHPSSADLARFRAWQRESLQRSRQLALLAERDTRTRDGVEIALHANAESAADIALARNSGAAGIGLYRTEFLFLQRRELPAEEEQYLAYREVVLGMGGLPVTIRTLDLGADKADSSGLTLDDEENPALGVRGVRLSLRHPELMRTQLRAILRASAYGPVRILVPMICAAEEMQEMRALLNDCARDLRSEAYEIAENVELGAMIEVPAAAIALAGMIHELDFVSIGTNDLVQYTLAVDRNNDHLANLYDPLHPAVLKLLAQIIATGKRAGKRVSLCGEMAGDRNHTALLLALGLTDFSMHPGVLLEVRERIASLDLSQLRKHSAALLRAPTRERIARVLARMGA
ncbi:MAG: phosphoenolpyruvate--protein phosphotransferase [Dokdonella sp.]|uniref:phosphoenolpyruvate--protein phosphotransferase n=1 Tax=Dokdonella sp. TaxID=2291710 RepID=UPI0025BE5AB6|nr:phosphoenolpyruvate--protein phosphotransferase [Dokdonella sp.]MBZ0222789.1 phosphoenolpyruvate--protein phosphotransferase [Dokdonella sp.]